MWIKLLSGIRIDMSGKMIGDGVCFPLLLSISSDPSSLTLLALQMLWGGFEILPSELIIFLRPVKQLKNALSYLRSCGIKILLWSLLFPPSFYGIKRKRTKGEEAWYSFFVEVSRVTNTGHCKNFFFLPTFWPSFPSVKFFKLLLDFEREL